MLINKQWNIDDFKNIIQSGGFIKCGWDGIAETEKKIKHETNATIRCILLNQNSHMEIFLLSPDGNKL